MCENGNIIPPDRDKALEKANFSRTTCS